MEKALFPCSSLFSPALISFLRLFTTYPGCRINHQDKTVLSADRPEMSFVGPVKSIFESYEDILKSGDVFMVNASALIRICDKDQNKFDCVLKIIDKKAETQDSDDDSGVSEGQ